MTSSTTVVALVVLPMMPLVFIILCLLSSPSLEELSQALTKKVKDIVDKEAGKNSWSKIRSLIDADARSFADSLSEKLDVDEQTKKQANEDTYMEFKNYGRGEVERTIRLEAADHRSVLLHLKYRFLTSLFLQPPKKNVEEMGRIAYSEALEFLSFMEAIRLDDNDANIVEQEPKDAPVPSSKALINPGDYADLRRKFREYAESMIRDKITKVAQVERCTFL